MKKIAFVVVLAIMFFSCSDKETVEKPSKLLSENEMTDIMYDIAILQAMKSYTPSKLSDNNIEPSKFIYEKYKIDSITFVQNSRYYASQMDVYQTMQKNVLSRLDRERTEAEKQVKKDKKAKPDKDVKKPGSIIKKDSLRKSFIKRAEMQSKLKK